MRTSDAIDKKKKLKNQYLRNILGVAFSTSALRIRLQSFPPANHFKVLQSPLKAPKSHLKPLKSVKISGQPLSTAPTPSISHTIPQK